MDKLRRLPGKTVTKILGTAAIVSMLLAAWSAPAEKFLIPVLPDTQRAVNEKPAMFESQIDWIVANKSASNIAFVLHVGDIVDWDTPDHAMWITASNGFLKLDKAAIPYVVVAGNHDTGVVTNGGRAPGDAHANIRDTKRFNEFFPVSRFPAQRGRYHEGKSDNAWYTFTASGLQWLVLGLEFCPRPGVLDWARTVVINHPNHNVIVLTHFHLATNGTIAQHNARYGDLSPQEVFDQLISRHPNILMVLSGHVGFSAWRIDRGEKGNAIYQLLQNYQSRDYGGGYIRLLEIDTDAGTISASMYSPFYDDMKEDVSRFSFSNVQFIGASRTPKTQPQPAEEQSVSR
jgi:hypothetical protein